MKKALILVLFLILVCPADAQQNNPTSKKVDPDYFITSNREELIYKLVDLPCGIQADDLVKLILQKIQNYLVAFQPTGEYSDDIYTKAANVQALKSVMQGGYGIGSVLVNTDGKIIASAHNSQIQKHRSDLHTEMTLLTNFEESCLAKNIASFVLFLSA